VETVHGQGLDVRYEMKAYKRIDGKLKYTCDGPPFERFPHEAPGSEAFYRAGRLPFPWKERLGGKGCCAQ
jgi:hypothetical protein